MDSLVAIFHITLYQPLFNALILLYKYLPGHDLGIAIVILTLASKFLLYPLGVKAIKSQKILSALQPQIKEIQEKFKDNKEKQTRAVLEFYKKEKINPFSGFLTLLVQFPILIALFRLFWNGFGESQLRFLYGFVSHPGQINTGFLGLVDLAEPSAILALITGLSQFVQAKMMTPARNASQAKRSDAGGPDFSKMMQKQMLYFFPVFTVFILWKLPSALALYWLVSTLFTIGQQYLILKKHDSK